MVCLVKKDSIFTWQALPRLIVETLCQSDRLPPLTCQITSAMLTNRPSSISCQADLPAGRQATQLRVLIIKSTEYLMHAYSFESLALTSQVQSSFRSERHGPNMNLRLHNGKKGALLDQPLQPLTANSPWHWWSETPIVLRIAKNTRCVTQLLLRLEVKVNGH